MVLVGGRLTHRPTGSSRHGAAARLQPSRPRVIATADPERRRIERDLHDRCPAAAGQRIHPSAPDPRSRRRDETDRDRSDTSRRLSKLPVLARGAIPAVPSTERLRAALEVLATTFDVPTTSWSTATTHSPGTTIASDASVAAPDAARQAEAASAVISVERTTAPSRFASSPKRTQAPRYAADSSSSSTE
jgi:hypothetical protein